MIEKKLHKKPLKKLLSNDFDMEKLFKLLKDEKIS